MIRTKGDAEFVWNLQAYALPASVIDVSGFHAAVTEAVAVCSALSSPDPLAEGISDPPGWSRGVLSPWGYIDPHQMNLPR